MVPDPMRERTHGPPAQKGVLQRDQRTPGQELKAAWRRIWRDERPAVAVPRDIVLVLLGLMVLLGGMWVYTGQPFPDTSPLVVVESGSMMHPDPAFGRVGTIDPGDLVLVQAVRGARDVETAYGDPQRTGYGGKGDVIVYRPHGSLRETPIIHRAITWVEVTEVPTSSGEPQRRYTYVDASGALLTDQPSVTLESIGIRDRQFPTSGFVTKGDNPATNRVADQVSHVRDRLVEPDWIIGNARGEIPWIGLVKLALAGNPMPSDTSGQCPFLLAWAPCDTWFMLAGSFAVLILVPFGLEKAYPRSRTLQRWLK